MEAMQRLGDQGEVTGYLPREQAMARLCGAAVAVAPAQWDDPCPLSVIESLAGGCATAASPRGGIPEIVGDAGILIDGGVEAWAAQLLRLAGDGALQRHYQQAARERAVQALDIHHTVAQLDALRRELTTERGT
jgi:glycosyltransferase involved in cell wall biosynthesis